VTALNPRERLDAFWSKNMKCLTCRYCTDVSLFGETFCAVNDFMIPEQHSIAHGWNWPNSLCENHNFKDKKLERKFKKLIREAWQSEAHKSEQ
jgi:hypothetical protein